MNGLNALLPGTHGVAAALLSLALIACGGAEPADVATTTASSGGEFTDAAGNQNAPPPSAPQPLQVGAGGLPGQPAPDAGSGANPEDPIMACGPADSYRRVAEYRCPDGTQPLGGDPSDGGRARVGNVGANSRGHVIDLYRIPCPAGAQEIYVDMYGCPELQQLLGR